MYENNNPFNKPKHAGDTIMKLEWERDRVIQDAKQLYAALKSVIGATQMETFFPAEKHPWLKVEIE